MILESKRLILRPWQESDIEFLIEGLNDIEVSKWLSLVPYPYTKKDAKNWLNYCSNCNNETDYEFAIALKESTVVIGGTSIIKIDRNHQSTKGGIWINRSYHGKGYGFEALEVRTKFAFDVLKLRRLENGYFAGNDASYKIQSKLGYTVEATKKKAVYCKADGKCKVEVVTSLLNKNWNDEGVLEKRRCNE